MKRNHIIKWGGTILAAAIVATGVWSMNQETDEITIPQTVEFIDTEDGSVIVEDEEVPLGTKPTVTVKTTTKKSVKKNKLKTKAKKTKKTTKKTTTKRTTTKENSTQKVKTETTVKTTVLSKTKKKSAIQTVTTTVKTTVKTTTTNKPKTTTTSTASTTTTTTSSSAAASTTAAAATASASSASETTSTVSTVLMRNLATGADANVLEAYELMGFTTEINPSKTYSGYFSAVDHKIILQTKKADTAYHELGHFVAWLAGNVDTKSEFVAIYSSEKDSMTGSNKAYNTKNSSEYFAESYREYVTDPSTLKANRPKTYEYLQQSIAKITTARAKSIKSYYDQVYWN